MFIVVAFQFISGLKEDMLGFRINLALDFFVVKVGKPNEKKAWIDSIERVYYVVLCFCFFL